MFGEEKILPGDDRVLASPRTVYDHTEAWLAETTAPDLDQVDTD